MKKINKNKLKSFTLIEMATVIIVIAIITAVTLPYFFSFHTGQELKSSARVIASVLRTAKSCAAAKNADYQVVFSNPHDNELEMTIYELDKSTTPPTTTQVGKTEKLKVSAAIEFGTTFTDDKVTFSPQGTPNPAGKVKIEDTGKSKEIEVAVSPVTGRVKIGDIE